MRTQGELEQIPQPVVKQISELETRIMTDIVRRIRANGFSSTSSDWQITKLQQFGESEQAIKRMIREALGDVDISLDKIFSDTVYEEYYGHSRAYELFGREQLPFEENIQLQELIEGVRRQTGDSFRNMTNSMGFAIKDPATGKITYSPLMKFYQDTMDSAMWDIFSGAFDFNTVLERTVNQMTVSGIRWIDYDSGARNRIDVAARRAIMTGFRQIQGKINEQVAKELGTDRYEVSAHTGARPTHQPWQGRVFTMRQLIDTCGLGQVDGLLGINCYHDYRAFPEGSIRTYTDGQLKQMMKEENTPKEYNGKQYKTYEALQKQRYMERVMRKTRQDIKLLKEGGAPEQEIILKKAKYQGQLQDYTDFSKAMKLPGQMKRVYQDGLQGKFTPGKQEQAKLSKMWEDKLAAVERKVRYSKFSEHFSEYNNGQKDVITVRKLLNNLNKSKVGQETVKYISDHPELEIKMCYKVDAPENILGVQDKNDIYIYATRTATVQRTAEVLVHEITHHRYNIGESQWAECVCFAQELKHRTGKNNLTGNELKDIIKTVKALYPTLPWR